MSHSTKHTHTRARARTQHTHTEATYLYPFAYRMCPVCRFEKDREGEREIMTVGQENWSSIFSSAYFISFGRSIMNLDLTDNAKDG